MHVVLCGQIRLVACAKALLVQLSKARRAGHIDGVTWVVWQNQVDLAKSLNAAVPPAIDRLVAIDEPEMPSPGHFFHQVRSLEEGMANIHSRDLVLRLRPDIFVEDGFFQTVRRQITESGKPLWTPYADLTAPFFACDIIFGGRAEVLQQQTNYSTEPYINALPPMSSRSPAGVMSHEPEVQRWLHPARGHDEITGAYWSTFPSFGFATRLRRELVKRYQAWDFYSAIRLRWLDYLLENVSLGGLDHGARAGLVRADDLNAREGQIWLLQNFETVPPSSARDLLEIEQGGFVWATDLQEVANLRQSLAIGTPARHGRQPREVFAELREIKAAAAQASQGVAQPALQLPFRMAKAVYKDEGRSGKSHEAR